MKLGFVGLGNMGAPMARNLVAIGFEVSVFDIEPSRTAPFHQSNVPVAASAAMKPEVSFRSSCASETCSKRQFSPFAREPPRNQEYASALQQ